MKISVLSFFTTVRFFMVLATLILFAGPVAEAQKRRPTQTPEADKSKTIEQKMLDGAAGIANSIDKAAEKIDITLAGKKYTKKKNTSNISLRQLVTWSEGGRIDTSTDFNVDLRLPNLEKRWQLRFSSYNEEEEKRDLSQRRVRTRARERDPGAALMFMEKLGKVRTLFQPRLELKDPLEVSYILRFESDAVTKNGFRFAPKVELFADPQKGTGEYGSLDFIWEINKKWELAWQNSEEYRDYENFFSTQHGLSLDYGLSDTEALGTSISFGSHNRPQFHLDSFTYNASYTKQVYQNLLRFGLSPFITFAKARHFKGYTGISLNVELVF